ncbi:glycosyltransferase family 61 protein [Persicobacter psychrovividus]|uniref:Glycosyltransferase 61 catalytic domain-containing protein n=1 Tax=Persicobacter psychrovividus TaxID=387638 RepID=A0ABN6L8K8_9BACT|nr:hypothetical protein PEPS_17900 [Persicobacter psychrovividus]
MVTVKKLKSIARRQLNGKKVGRQIASVFMRRYLFAQESEVNLEQIPVIPPEPLPMVVPEHDFIHFRDDYKTQNADCETPPSSLTIVENCTVFTDNLFEFFVLQNNLILQQHSYFHRVDSSAEACSTGHYLPKIRKPRQLQGSVFSMVIGGGKDNYFHWMVDAIPRLWLLKKSGRWDDIDWFLMPNYSLTFQKQSIEFFGIPEEKIINAENIEYLQCERLYLPTTSRYNGWFRPWLMDFFKAYTAELTATIDAAPYIYISRGDASQRRVTNEDEVILALQKQGFDIIQLSKLSFQKQIALFKQAKVIIAPHGAALTNLFFCEPKTKVIEVFPSEYVSPLYQELALRLNLQYKMLICPSIKGAHKNETLHIANKADIEVPIDALHQSVSAYLEETKDLIGKKQSKSYRKAK